MLAFLLTSALSPTSYGATGRGSGGGGLSALPSYALTNNQTTPIVLLNSLEVSGQFFVTGPIISAPFVGYTVDTGSPKTNIHVNAALGNIFRVLLTNNMGLVITNGTDGQELSIELYQDGTGNRTVTHVPNTGGALTNNWQFGEDITSPITLTTNQYKKDVLKLRYEVTNLATNTSLSNWCAIGMLRKYPN